VTTLLEVGAISVQAYRDHTGDRSTAGTSVTGALVEAEGLLEEQLNRSLAWAERTKTFTFYPDGRIYPDAWPITEADLYIEGRALLGAMPDRTVFIGYFPTRPPNRMTITWTGGFDDGTNSARLPYTLANALYEVAQALASDRQPIPVGATSVSVGDVSVGFSAPAGGGGLDALVPGVSNRIKAYRYRSVG